MMQLIFTHQGSGDRHGDHREAWEGGGEGAHALLVGPLAEPAEELLAGEDDVTAVDARVRVLYSLIMIIKSDN